MTKSEINLLRLCLNELRKWQWMGVRFGQPSCMGGDMPKYPACQACGGVENRGEHYMRKGHSESCTIWRAMDAIEKKIKVCEGGK